MFGDWCPEYDLDEPNLPEWASYWYMNCFLNHLGIKGWYK